MRNLPDIYQRTKEKLFPDGFSDKPLKTGQDYRFSVRGQREYRRGFLVQRNRMMGV